jgi:hypothetical protein
MKRDLTKLIERVESFEQRLDVVLSGLYAASEDDSDWVSVRGELRPRQGDTLRSSVKLTVTAFDAHGRVIDTGHAYFDKDEIFGFETFEIDINVSADNLAKLRLHPSQFDT